MIIVVDTNVLIYYSEPVFDAHPEFDITEL
jgi:hypothetical protein